MANLQEPILDLDTGIRNVHFFNGRLLTGEDLRAEQSANARQHASLAKAIGAGIVTGLEVELKTKTPPVVTVTPGCALNRLGQMLEVLSPTDVSLKTDVTTASSSSGAGVFSACPATSGATGAGDFTGVFLLIMGPVFSYEGQAPKHETFDAGVATGCGTAYELQGVQFQLIEVKLGDLSEQSATRELIQSLIVAEGAASQSKLRNLLAHACFGTEDLAHFAAEPFGGATNPKFNRYGALDRLRDDGRLEDCAVPLALTYWSEDGLEFLDMWSVRRRVFPSDESHWAPFVGPRRLAEGQAVFQQFQWHLSALLEDASIAAASVQARQYFRYLPSVGLLPVNDGGADQTPGTADDSQVEGAGFDLTQFFTGMQWIGPAAIEGRQVRPLLEASFGGWATDLDRGESHWLYTVRENQEGVQGGTGPHPYLVFANQLHPSLSDSFRAKPKRARRSAKSARK